ncbi:MAG: hypothetical protein J6Y32_03685 [Bacteroidales bacterium]|nr:hypothetical protein [Bacteroidales bacterium]
MIEYRKRTFSKSETEEVKPLRPSPSKEVYSLAEEKTLKAYANICFWFTLVICVIAVLVAAFAARNIFWPILLSAIPAILLALVPRAFIFVFANISVTLKEINAKLDEDRQDSSL